MNRKTSQTNIRKLMHTGRVSIAVTIPKEILFELGWREKQRVVVKRQGKNVIISDWQEEPSIENIAKIG